MNSEIIKFIGACFNFDTFLEYICRQSPKLDFLQPYHDKATSLRQNIEKQTENILNQGLNANSVTQVSLARTRPCLLLLGKKENSGN